MSLVRLFLEHLLPSLAVGVAAWLLTGQQALVLVALATGWLIDTDHLLDWYLARRRDPRLSLAASTTSGDYFVKNGKIFLPLHSWELAVAWGFGWWLAGRWEVGITGTIAWVIHLGVDHLSYRLNPLIYFLWYRLYVDFDINKLCKRPIYSRDIGNNKP